MPSIRIRNIGPIKDTGKIDLARVTVLIGQQSTGKSTIMKILCFCCWVEKYCVTHNNTKWFASYQHFYKTLKSFHHFQDSFFTPKQSCIDYEGEWYSIRFNYESNKTNADIRNRHNSPSLHNTKLCFIPSERNLISSVRNVDAAYKVKAVDNIFNYILEWDEVKRAYNREHFLPMNFLQGMDFFYDSKNGREIIRLNSGKEITPYYASSGVQSAYSLYVMLDYLTSKVFNLNAKFSRKDLGNMLVELLNQEKLSPEELIERKNQLASIVLQRMPYRASRVFIEEPEQNLFPSAQVDLIRNVVRMINSACDQTGNECSVCITTHSPYIVSALNLLIQAYDAFNIAAARAVEVLPKEEMLPFDQVACYFVHENGSVESITHKEDGIGAIEASSALDGISDIIDEWMYKFNLILSEYNA